MEKPPFGVVLGSYKGVDGYSNRKASRSVGAGPNYVNGIFTGYKYQCVEYARRWMVVCKQLKFDDVGCAFEIWEFDHVHSIHTDESTPMIGVPNGSNVPPVADTLLIYARGHGVPWGHVAVITEVDLEGGFARIAEQNDEDRHWPGNYARQLRLEIRNGAYIIHDKYPIIGWMIFENLEQLGAN